MDALVDISFECLPLRSVGRLDVPLDASDVLRRRLERIASALEAFGAERTYFLYKARCVYRFANSDVDGICRFEFEGIVRTDAGDRLCEQTMLDVTLVSDTCGGVPADVELWLADRVRQAVAIEFDRFVAAGRLPPEDGSAPGLDVSGLAGI
jgi:hypothetical protein